MQFISKDSFIDLLQFVERQIVFTIETTRNVNTYHDFLLSQDSMVLFNSTCMCLQSIGEVIKQVDDRTLGKLFALYPNTPWKRVIGMRNIPWKRVIGMRNIISHEYLSVDPQIIFATVKVRLHPLLTDIRQILSDIEAGLRDDVLLTPTNA